MKCNGGLGIIPKTNLVSNIGVIGSNNTGIETFFHNRKLPDIEKYEIRNPPPFVVSDYGYSKHWFNKYFLKNTSLIYRVKRKLLGFLKEK
jgi:hypothetical protein